MMEETTTTAGPSKQQASRMVVVAAIAGLGLGIGGMTVLGASSDPITVQAASVPGQEERSPAAADAEADDRVSLPEPTAVTTEPEPSAEDAEPAGGVIDRAAAEQAALAYLGEGRVTWVSQEDDYGAAWEIEVTLPNGREVDVYVDAAGQVVRTIPSLTASAGGAQPAAPPTTRQDAAPPAAPAAPTARQDAAPPVTPTAPAPRTEVVPSAPRGEAAPSAPRTEAARSDAATTPRTNDTNANATGGVVDRAAAEQAALAYLGEGRVTWVSQEDDYGAAWEIEVTLPNGREVDVYVDAAGRVVNTS